MALPLPQGHQPRSVLQKRACSKQGPAFQERRGPVRSPEYTSCNASAGKAHSVEQQLRCPPTRLSAPRLESNLPMALPLDAVCLHVLQWGLVGACFRSFAGGCTTLQVPYLGSDAVHLRCSAALYAGAARTLLCCCRPAYSDMIHQHSTTAHSGSDTTGLFTQQTPSQASPRTDARESAAALFCLMRIMRLRRTKETAVGI